MEVRRDEVDVAGPPDRDLREVSFEDRYMQPQVGVVTRINKQTATIDTGDGKSWRVSFQLLRHVLDI